VDTVATMILIKLRALVVDDSRVMRHMIMETLKKTGLAEFTFTQAEDGFDALKKMEANDFHLAFIDWNMPNMTGLELIRTVRANALAANDEAIPMVMVTSERTLGRIEEAVDQAGAHAFICKPFSAAEMTKKLERIVQLAVDVRVRKMRKDHQNAAPISGSVFAKLFG
jgi:two-component system, chemotaxis family, chemotaxis protein CheY